MSRQPESPLFKGIDCLRLPVGDLDEALAFYRDRLGHELVWRSETAAGLRLAEGDGEIVLQTERPDQETNLLVASVEEAVESFVAAGGRVVAEPFDIQIGKCAVVRDPFGNVLVMLDMSKGRLVTDKDGRIVGNENLGA
ncbi:MAG: VOC family protein [Chloroflexi bacterium]|nr:VOC family protein [Chloroflexota bacterium]